ncbi:MAG TPA: T9SS type A sorting domain-containing protein [bacterium]|nr:T9SS type A sorting domain-containing protein [bacterium]HQJ65800.1 T9SS type A sorting domain-containing protein [bacterium]
MKRLSLMKWMTILLFTSNHLLAQWIQTAGPKGGEVKCLASVDSILFAGTEDGVFRSIDNGASWNPTGLENIVYSLAVKSDDESSLNLFAGTYNGGVFLSTDNGDNWNQMNFGLLNHYVNCLAASDSNIFAGTKDGVFRSPSNGTYWIPASSGLGSKSIRSLNIYGKNLYAGTDSGLFISTDNGANWTSAGLKGEAVNAFTINGSYFFAGTDTSGVLISADNGVNWQMISIPDMSKRVFSLAVMNNSLYAGTGMGIYRTPSNGAYWIPSNTGLGNQPAYTLYIRGTDLFAGTMGGVFRSTNSGDNWTDINTGLITTKVHSLISSGTDLYAGVWGGIFQSHDNGNTWTALSRGSACFSLLLSETKLYAGGGNHVGCYDLVKGNWEWVPVGMGWIRALATNGTTLFAGSEGSGVFRIIHHAPGWWTITKTNMQDTMVFALAVKDSFIFAGTGGGVFRSSNNGATWSDVNNGLTNLSVAALAVNGAKLFAGTAGGGVFLTTNDGASWTPVNDGLSGLALDILSFVFSENNLFIGTWQGGVYVLKENATSWTAINTGLMHSMTQPSSVVHGLAIAGTDLYAGTRGAGVWHRPLSETITSGGSISREQLMIYSLEQNYPNPFNPSTTIEFVLPKSDFVMLKVFNLLGEEVATLVSEQRAAGIHRHNWDASGLANGIYLYRLEAGEFVQSKKLVLMR